MTAQKPMHPAMYQALKIAVPVELVLVIGGIAGFLVTEKILALAVPVAIAAAFVVLMLLRATAAMAGEGQPPKPKSIVE